MVEELKGITGDITDGRSGLCSRINLTSKNLTPPLKVIGRSVKKKKKNYGYSITQVSAVSYTHLDVYKRQL